MANKSKGKRYPKILYMIFGMACLLIIMASAIAEGGRFIPAAVFSFIGLFGLWYVAKGVEK